MTGPAGRATPEETPPTQVGAQGERGVDRVIELLLVGLVAEEDELLGDLAEERAQRAAGRGDRAARRWHRSQSLRAVPQLLWNEVTRGPRMSVVLGVLAGAVTIGVVTTVADIGTVFDSRYSPDAHDVLVGTVWRALAMLLAGLLGGAVAALPARRARLMAVIPLAAVAALWAARRPFYAVLVGPGVPIDGGYAIDLSPTSDQLVSPVLWQMPTMAVLMPAAILIGGLAVVALTRWSSMRRR